MARMLFVTWNDGFPAAQFSLPPGTTLEQITSEPVWLDDGGQFMLDASRVRAAYLIDVPDGTMIFDAQQVPVEAEISAEDRAAAIQWANELRDIPLGGEPDEAVTQVEWPQPEQSVVDTGLIGRYAEPYE